MEVAADLFLEEPGEISGIPQRKAGFVDKEGVVFSEIEIEEILRFIGFRDLKVRINSVCLKPGETEGIITEREDRHAVRIFLIGAKQLTGDLF